MTRLSPMANRGCAVAGCCAKHDARGLCRVHYRRARRHGGIERARRAAHTGSIKHGYLVIQKGGVSRAAHIDIAELALGHPLPTGAQVHHVNGVRSDNRPGNLVICPSQGYHQLLHLRQRALDACGNATYRKCPFCKAYDDPARMHEYKRGGSFYHVACGGRFTKVERFSKCQPQ